MGRHAATNPPIPAQGTFIVIHWNGIDNTTELKAMEGSLFNDDELSMMDQRSDPAQHPFSELIAHYGVVMPPSEARHLFDELLHNAPWARRNMMLHGREVEMPRDIAWYGVARGQGIYGRDPQPWPPLLLEAKRHVEKISGYMYNGCLCNLYRTGQDSVAWHSDKDALAGAVASLSLGATRTFRVRSKNDHSLTHDFPLVPGSLLVMLPGCQQATEHAVPKTKRPVGLRINLTFRQVGS